MHNPWFARQPLWPWLLVLAVLCLPFAAQAERRVALVIGNASYQSAQVLANPLNDARAISDKLRAMGFEVSHHEDLDGQSFRMALGEFSEAALNSDIALVFYAGHGIEMAGVNHLIPIDARMRSEATAQYETVPLEQVLTAVRSARKLGLVLLDACRNNPFSNSMARIDGKRAVSRGLSPVAIDGERGLLISFAAEAGATADDGDTRHSPYTQALLDTIDQPGLEVNRLFRTVRAKVRETSRGGQVPIEYAQLPDEDIFLVPASASGSPAPQPVPQPAPVVAPPRPAPVEDPLLAYLNAVQANDRAALEAFISRYPDHVRARDARAMVQQMAEAEFWDRAQGMNSTEGYRTYIIAFPDGAHRAEAEARILALTPQPVPVQPQPVPQPLPQPPVVAANSCQDLWYARNAIFASKGFCFKTARAQAAFGTACTTSNPRFTAAEKAQIDSYAAMEKARGC